MMFSRSPNQAPRTPRSDGPRIGLALGGGGARGLAHIPMLEVFDELGITPHMIAGTSIGAIIGALYASGLTASQIRQGVDDLVAEPKSWKQVFESKPLFAWLEFIDIEIGRSSLLKADSFLQGLGQSLGIETFEELHIPLKVVATDFWGRDEVVFEKGPIVPAVAASFAIPGIFKPQVIDDRVLLDGSCVNPLPFDLLIEHCDIVVAVDVMGKREPAEDLIPSFTETVFNGLQIAEKSILREKFKIQRPDIFIDMEISDVRVLDFHKSGQVYAQSAGAAQTLRRELPRALELDRALLAQTRRPLRRGLRWLGALLR